MWTQEKKMQRIVQRDLPGILNQIVSVSTHLRKHSEQTTAHFLDVQNAIETLPSQIAKSMVLQLETYGLERVRLLNGGASTVKNVDQVHALIMTRPFKDPSCLISNIA